MEPEFLEQVPSDHEAERAVIGSCLLSQSAAAHCVTKLDAADFLFKPFGWMFTAIGQMHAAQQPINAQTVIRRLGEMRVSPQSVRTCLAEMDGPEVVIETLEGTMPEDVEFWADRVKKKRTERDLLAFAEKARRVALSNPEDIKAQLAKLEESIANVGSSDTERTVYTLEEALDGLDERINAYIEDPDRITGLPVGWGEFDRRLDGLQPGNVTICYAPSSRYKSMFVQNIGWSLARNNIPGLWFTTEMPRHQISERILQLELGMNFRWMRRDRTIHMQKDEILRASKYTRGFPVFIDDRSDPEIGYMRSLVAKHKKWHDIQYVIVDLVDHVGSTLFKEDSISQQSLVMRQLKAMAKTSNIHVIAVSHVAKGDRALRQKADLDVEDMKGSSSKYQDVDTAISLMPVVWDGEKGDWRALDRNGITWYVEHGGILTVLVAITKNRHGELGRMPFTLDLNRGGRMFPEIRRPEQKTLPNDE